VGAHTFTVAARDAVGNAATGSHAYAIVYATGPCLGEPGHQILPPIRADGSTEVKRGSTVPAKFRVCDATGTSIGAPGTVVAFTMNGTAPVPSTIPHATFRWDPQAQQWIYDIDTDALAAGSTNVFRVVLNDGTWIEFSLRVR
jgi:hypothetical protein